MEECSQKEFDRADIVRDVRYLGTGASAHESIAK
jgi:hypothetical protein